MAASVEAAFKILDKASGPMDKIYARATALDEKMQGVGRTFDKVAAQGGEDMRVLSDGVQKLGRQTTSTAGRVDTDMGAMSRGIARSTGAAGRNVDELQAKLSVLDATRASPTVNLDGVASAVSQAQLLSAELDRLDGRTVRINVETSGSGIGGGIAREAGRAMGGSTTGKQRGGFFRRAARTAGSAAGRAVQREATKIVSEKVSGSVNRIFGRTDQAPAAAARQTSAAAKQVGKDAGFIDKGIKAVAGRLVGFGTIILGLGPIIEPFVGALGGLVATLGGGALGAGVGLVGGLGAAVTGFGALAAVALPMVSTLKNLQTAQTAYNTAIATYGKNSTEAQTAAKKLQAAQKAAGPANQMMRSFMGLKQRWSNLTQPGQKALAGSISDDIKQMEQNLVPMFARIGNKAANAFGKFSGTFLDKLDTPMFRRDMKIMGDTFDKVAKPAGGGFANLIKVFTNIAAAAKPQVIEFFKWFDRWTGDAAKSTKDIGNMHKLFASWEDDFKGIVRFGKQLSLLVGSFFNQGRGPGRNLLAQMTQQIKEWRLEVQKDPGATHKWFRDMATNAKDWASEFGHLATELGKIVNMLSSLIQPIHAFTNAVRSIIPGNTIIDEAGALGASAGVLYAGRKVGQGIAKKGVDWWKNRRGLSTVEQAGASTIGAAEKGMLGATPETAMWVRMVGGPPIPGSDPTKTSTEQSLGQKILSKVKGFGTGAAGYAAGKFAQFGGLRGLGITGGAAAIPLLAQQLFNILPKGQVKSAIQQGTPLTGSQHVAPGTHHIGQFPLPGPINEILFGGSQAANAPARLAGMTRGLSTKTIDIAKKQVDLFKTLGDISTTVARKMKGPGGIISGLSGFSSWLDNLGGTDGKGGKTGKNAKGWTDVFDKAGRSIKGIFNDLSNRTSKTADSNQKNVSKSFGDMSSSVQKSNKDMRDQTVVTFGDILNELNKDLKGLGVGSASTAQTASSAAGGGSATGNPQSARGGRGGSTPGGGGGPKQQPKTKLAGGGVVPGSDMHDNYLLAPGVLAAGGERVVNRHTMQNINHMLYPHGTSVDQMIAGEGKNHYWPMSNDKTPMITSRQAKGGKVPQKTSTGPVNFYGHPTGVNPSIRNLIGLLEGKFPGLMVSATTDGTHVSGSLHYSGDAVDMASGDYGLMDSAAGWIVNSGLYHSLTEGIHNPNLSVKYGKIVPDSYYAAVWAAHRNHLHLGIRGQANLSYSGGAGGAAGGAAGAPAPQLKKRKGYQGPGSARQQMSQGAIDQLTAAGQKKIDQKAGAGGGGAMGGAANVKNLPRSLQQYNHLWQKHWSPDFGGPTMPVNKIAELAEWAGMPGVTMAQIAHGESGYRPGAGGTDPGGTQGYGLWAITSPFHPEVSKYGGYEAMLNPINNALVAAGEYKSSGLSGWYGTKYLTGDNQHYTGSMNSKGGVVPWFGDGANFTAHRPTLIGVGDGHGPEDVAVTPRDRTPAGGPSSRPITIGTLNIENHRPGDIRKQLKEELSQLAAEIDGMGDTTQGDLIN